MSAMNMKLPSTKSVLWGRIKWVLFISIWLTVTRVSAQDEFGDLLGRINNLRASKGLPAYTLNGALSSAAQSQAQWLVENGCAIAHVHPDGSSPRSRALAAGYATSDVSENIYCGGIARLDDAWIFWLNSAIHYAGLVNIRYSEVGIGIAHGANSSGFALVFGNPGGPAYVPPAVSNSDSSAPQQPSFVVGVDEHGNIEHQIQAGDTLGDILLIYGYTWAELPALLELNQMTQDDFRTLKVGTILLIPPRDGTYTPTPGDAAPTATLPPPTVEPTSAGITEATTTATETPLTPDPIAPPQIAATSNSIPAVAALVLAEDTLTPAPSPTSATTEVALVSTPVLASKSAGVVTASSGTSPWLVLALVVQVAVLLGAGFEFIRRLRRR